MGKKVYIGNDKYCYTENCSIHDHTPAGGLIIQANEAGAAGNISEFLRLREKAASLEKETGIKSTTRIVYPSFSPEGDKPKPKPPNPQLLTTNNQQRVNRRKLTDAELRKILQSRIADLQSKPVFSDKEPNIVAFHKDVGFPEYFRAPRGSVKLRYSHHAVEATTDDRYGDIPILDEAVFDELDIIELKYDRNSGRLQKMLLRKKEGDDQVCIVVAPTPRGPWRVVTTWFNKAGDRHSTLNTAPYAKPTRSKK